MKKIFVSLLISLCAVSFAFAQDLEKATELYNNAATMYNDGDKTGALDMFQKALDMATAIGDDGIEVANNCKNLIPGIILSLGKEAVQAKEMDKAVETLKKAIEKAKEFGNADVEAEAASLIPDIMMAKAGSLLNAKDFAGAAAAYKEVVAADPENAMAYLRMGMALNGAGQTDEAVEALTAAAAKGQESAAGKQLSNIFLKKAVACQKAKDMKGVLENAQKSAEYLDNANAQKLIGTSALSLKQNKVAADAFEAYLALSPNAKDKVQTIYQLGTALVALGDNAKACGYFKEIAQDAQWGEAARYQITTLKCN